MKIDQLIKLLATVTLVEMMVTIGLGVTFGEVFSVCRNWTLVERALVANYLLVPGAAMALLLWFHPNPMIAAGFLIAAVCPGAPYGPPFTALAKGNVTLAIGLMVVLAGSSAFFAPLLLGLLLPFVTENSAININVFRIIRNLMGTQLLPLCLGLWIRQARPLLADRLQKPAKVLSGLLNLLTLGVILVVQFAFLREIHLRGYFGMLSLVIACMAAGWLVGHTSDGLKSMVMTTSVRNVGVSLVIAAASFPGTPAISSATAYALFQTLVITLVALTWGQFTPGISLVKKHAA